ncbi:lipid A core-O-antigen ligase-like enyme [SAR116 cluster alpha proteobacterium HIMB100]|nr:lipid A core-O-antigen ligase-like enyme [SAR116 cluster alpha proteobacterium HIMB100]
MANSNPPLSELTLLGHIYKVVSDAKAALAELPKASRWFHVFWLLGPLILLIERSPADAWLTICALSFAVRAIVKKDGRWLKVFWVRAVFAFWGVCLLSAALSDLPGYSLGEAFIWIRFPLFAMASCFWLATDKRLLYAMMGMTMLGMIIMTGILTAEVLIVGQQGGRLSWPYGDLVPGNYLAKAGLPAFCVLVALAVSGYRQVNAVAAIISFATIILSVITGERINFIIRACGGMLAGLLWRPKSSRYACLILVEVLAVVTVFVASPDIGNRFVDRFIKQLPSHNESPYFRVMNSGMVAFETAPVLGVGTANYRILCAELTRDHTDVDCHTHPHNYYIQLLAETGIIGLVFGCVMLGAIIWSCAQTSIKGRADVVMATAVIIPLGLFFPLQSTADFFGQWNNIFMWSAVALALSSGNLMAKKAQIC